VTPSLFAAVAPAPKTAPAGAPPSPRGASAGGEGQDFARLLEGPQDAGAARKGPARADAPARQPGKDEAPARDELPGAPGEARPATEESAEAATAAPAATDETPGTDSDGEAAASDWPPPGLAWLLQPPEPAPPAPAAGAAVPAPVAGNAGEGEPAAAGKATAPLLPDLAAPASRPLAAAPSPAAEPLPQEDAAGEALDTLAGAARHLQALVPETGPESQAPAFVLPLANPAPVAAHAAALPATPAHLPTPQLGDAGFAEDVGSHVEWLAGQKISHAVIRVSPQDLGPVEVRLQLDGDRLSADFSSAQAEVRQALEQSLPRLREMLGQHGFELAHAGVGHGQAGDREAASQGRQGSGGEANGDEPAATAQPVRMARRGLLDAYA